MHIYIDVHILSASYANLHGLFACTTVATPIALPKLINFAISWHMWDVCVQSCQFAPCTGLQTVAVGRTYWRKPCWHRENTNTLRRKCVASLKCRSATLCVSLKWFQCVKKKHIDWPLAYHPRCPWSDLVVDLVLQVNWQEGKWGFPGEAQLVFLKNSIETVWWGCFD